VCCVHGGEGGQHMEIEVSTLEVRGQGLHGAEKARKIYNHYTFEWRFPDFDVHIA